MTGRGKFVLTLLVLAIAGLGVAKWWDRLKPGAPLATTSASESKAAPSSAKAGKLNMLCVNHSTRSPEFPDVPTLTEAGYPNSDVPLWFAIWAPTGMPQPIVEALHAKVTEISKAPDVPARLLLSGSLPVTSTQAELVAFHEGERKATSELIKAADIKLE